MATPPLFLCSAVSFARAQAQAVSLCCLLLSTPPWAQVTVQALASPSQDSGQEGWWGLSLCCPLAGAI